VVSPLYVINEVTNITADMLTGVCPDVAIEPKLHPLTGDGLRNLSSSTEDEAQLDVSYRKEIY
jgi:hypothetical protein